MRKRRKQIAAIILAAGMTVGGNAVSYGAGAGNVTDITGGAAESLGSPTKTTIKGTINITTVSVTVPLTAAFDIDPEAYDGAVGTQITGQSDSYAITNNSSSPVWVYISAVAQDSNVTLVDNTAALSGAKTMMLAIKKAGTATDSAVATQGFWLTPTGVDDNTKKYVLDPDTTEAKDRGKIAAGGTMKLNLYGLTQKGWTHNDKFQIQPSFMITVTNPFS